MAVKNIRTFEFKLGKFGLTLLIAGIGVLVFAAFVLGVTVGKDIDTYPEKIVRGIPRTITDGIAFIFPKAKSNEDAKGQDKASLDLTFYDALTKKGSTAPGMIAQENREEASTPAVIVAPAPPAVTASPSPSVPTPAPAPPTSAPSPPAMPPAPGTQSPPTPTVKDTAPKPAVSKPAAGAASGNKPVIAPKEKKSGTEPASPAPGPAAAANFSVQVVSYDERGKADQLQKKLQGLGYKAEVSELNIQGKGKWYRVMVNNYQTRKEAEKAADNINNKVKGLNSMVRQGDKP
jgi:cell division protein FtsN